MTAHLARRAAGMACVLLGAVVLLFALTLFIPGNAAQILLGPRATPDAVAAYAAAMGLDRPVWVRLGLYLSHILRGDLGRDVISGRPVLAMVAEVLPNTLALAASAIAFALALGVPLGCFAATHEGSRADQALAVLSVAAISVPNFVLAVLLLLAASRLPGWFPVLGGGNGAALVLPALALGFGWIGTIARLLRAALLEILGADHIRTLRAYGVPGRRIVGRYALKLAAIPLAAVLGLGIGRLLGGAIFVEIVFSRPGLGTLVFDAIGTRDYPVVQGAVLVAVALFAFANLVVDAVIGWLDPRTGDA